MAAANKRYHGENWFTCVPAVEVYNGLRSFATRKVRLLSVMLILGVGALAALSSVLAVGGSAVIHSSVARRQQANDSEHATPSAQEQNAGEQVEEGQGAERVAQAIADQFGVSKEEVLARHDQGIGFGALFKLFKLARAEGISVDALLAKIPSGENGHHEFGFGKLRKELTAEQLAAFESGPKNLGQLVSGKSKHEPEGKGSDESVETDQAGNNGHVPPGQAKKLAAH